jgi:hypothetical protein
MANEISKVDDIIDVRDVIARVEELEELLADENAFPDIEEETTFSSDGETDLTEESEELNTLKELLSDLAGNGGGEKWKGDWYPVTLIRDSYFEDYAQELVQDIGDLPDNIPGYLVIDWVATANNIQKDYSSVEFAGVTYWYR